MISSELDELSRWYDNKNLEYILKEVNESQCRFIRIIKRKYH